jgi:hypothetical protein
MKVTRFNYVNSLLRLLAIALITSFATQQAWSQNAVAPFPLVLDARTMSLKTGGHLAPTGYLISADWGYVGEQIHFAKET